MRALRVLQCVALGLSAAAAGCGRDGTAPATAILSLAPTALDLDTTRQAGVTLRNTGLAPSGAIELVAGPPVEVGSDAVVTGASLGVAPAFIQSLAPRAEASVSLSLSVAAMPPGRYRMRLSARSPGSGAELAGLTVIFRTTDHQEPGSAATVTIADAPQSLRQGDVVTLRADVRAESGELLPEAPIAWHVPGDLGLVTAAGDFVAYATGPVRVVATSGIAADTVSISVEARGLSGTITTLGNGRITGRYTSDLWVRGSAAYTGTWGCRTAGGGETLCGNTLYTWDVSTTAGPRLTDSLVVDATTVNDVKVSADGALAVITHEGSSDGRNGITLLSLADPLHPSVITRFTDRLTNGVHNTWIEGSYVYAVADGRGLEVIDVSTPSAPRGVASFYAGSSFLHDVYVRNGLAFLSHWNAGLVILDVGHGMAGGSPTAPVEISRISLGGETHNAWYWPGGGYVFVGEEDFGTPGIVHVVDASDLRAPRRVATYSVAGSPPHNFWVDEANAVLYVGYYSNGLRAVDVSGTLLGQLERQGREIAAALYGDGRGCQAGAATCTWAPQLDAGRLYASDMNSGLWIFSPVR